MTRKLTATERLERMLSVVPYISAAPGGRSIEEVCRRFDVDRDELVACLETVFMVGVHPYTPDALIDVVIDADHVQITMPEWFRRPLRLTAEQRLALLIARRTFRAMPGADTDGPLHRALDKVASTIGADAAGVDLAFDPLDESDLTRLRRAVDERRVVSFGYYSFGRDAHTDRRVEPWRVQLDGGHWYLEGRCLDAGEARTFRVDRVSGVEIIGPSFEPPDALPPLEVFPGSRLTRHVTLNLEPGARWAASQYPVESMIDLGEGRLRATFAVATAAWLERLLLRLGPNATLVDPTDDFESVAPAAARRLLSRYRD